MSTTIVMPPGLAKPRDSDLAQLQALGAEEQSKLLRELRKERQSWRSDRAELEHLRKLMQSDRPVSLDSQVEKLLEEKAQQEEQMDSYNEQIKSLKESVHTLQTELRDSNDIILQLKSESSEARRITDLEEQVNKWEVLYFESAEMGERQIERLERELEEKAEQLSTAQEETSMIKNELFELNDNNLNEELRQRIATLEAAEQRNQDQELTNENLQMQLDEATAKINNLEEELAARQAAAEEAEEPEEDLANELKLQLKRSTEKVAQLEKELLLTKVINDEESSRADDDMEQYVIELEKQTKQIQTKHDELKEILDHERIIAKNRESALKRKVEEMEEEVAVAKNRESNLIKEQAATLTQQAALIPPQDEELRIEYQKSQEKIQELEICLERLSQSALQESSSLASAAPSSHGGDDRGDAEMLQLRNKLAHQEVELNEARRKLLAMQKENSALRQVKDSLMGIDTEMEEVISALEDHQKELAEQTQKANEAWQEAASLKSDLNKEIMCREALQRDRHKLEADLLNAQERLDQVYMQLKEEEANHEEQVDLLKQQSAGLKESVVYHKNSLDVLQEALREANEELRIQTPTSAGQTSGQNSSSGGGSPKATSIAGSPLTGSLVQELQDLRSERDQLKVQVQEALNTAAAKEGGTNEPPSPAKEVALLQARIKDLEAEKDALDLEANMALHEKSALEERLNESHSKIAQLEQVSSTANPIPMNL